MIIDEKFLQYITGKICPYCGQKTKFVNSRVIYGTSYGMIYLCEPCNAYVGVHAGTKQSKGRLANEELRKAKIKVHEVFDPLFKGFKIEKITTGFEHIKSLRKRAYFWLASKMGIPKGYCHVGMFDVGDCEKAMQIIREAL